MVYKEIVQKKRFLIVYFFLCKFVYLLSLFVVLRIFIILLNTYNFLVIIF